MFSHRGATTLGFWAVLVASGVGAGLRAGETQTEDALAKFGLKRAGNTLVLTAEAEVHEKTTEVRRLYQELSNAVMLQRSTMSEKEYQDAIKQFTNETNQYRSQLNATNQMMGRIPRYRGRFMNNMVAEQYYELNLSKQQLQWEINRRTTFLNQLKKQPFDPKAKPRREIEVRDKTEELHKAGQDLRQAVDAIKEKYTQIEKDPAFKKALGPLEREAGMHLHLGPSRQFQLDVKLLEKLEAKESPGEAKAKGTRKTSRTTKRRPSNPPAGGEDAGSPF